MEALWKCGVYDYDYFSSKTPLLKFLEARQ